jgi:CHAD domain-containing protein
MNNVLSAHILLANELRRLAGMIGETQQRVLLAAGATGEATASDTEAVHDFRVALRRCRTVLRVGRNLWGTKQTRRLEDELKYYAQKTGTLRDDEVLRGLLTSVPVSDGDREAIQGWLAMRARTEKRNQRAIVRIVRDGPSLRQAEWKNGKSLRPLSVVLDKLEHLFGIEPQTPWTALEFAQVTVRKALRDVRRLAAADVDMTDEMHDLRIREKRLRYTVELFANELGEEGARLIAHATRMQRRLGDLHDVDEAIATIKRAQGVETPTKQAFLTALEATRTACAAKVDPLLAEARALDLPFALSSNESLGRSSA